MLAEVPIYRPGLLTPSQTVSSSGSNCRSGSQLTPSTSGESVTSSSTNQIVPYTAAIAFLQREHAVMLRQLHEQISMLQRTCSDLQFQLVFKTSKNPGSHPVPRHSDSSEYTLIEQREKCEQMTRELFEKDEAIRALEHKLALQDSRYKDEIAARNLIIARMRREYGSLTESSSKESQVSIPPNDKNTSTTNLTLSKPLMRRGSLDMADVGRDTTNVPYPPSLTRRQRLLTNSFSTDEHGPTSLPETRTNSAVYDRDTSHKPKQQKIKLKLPLLPFNKGTINSPRVKPPSTNPTGIKLPPIEGENYVERRQMRVGGSFRGVRGKEPVKTVSDTSSGSVESGGSGPGSFTQEMKALKGRKEFGPWKKEGSQ